MADADEEVKKARASEKEMSDELEKRRMKEKENAARMQTLVSENAKLVMEHERIEHEMELMGGDLAKAQSRIETLEEQYETCVRENQEKLRALNEKLLGQLRTSEALSSERLSQVNELTKTLEETSVDLKSAKERLLMLEEELKRTKLGAHDLHQEMDIKISEVHSLKMKNKWAFMITTFIIQVCGNACIDVCTKVCLHFCLAVLCMHLTPEIAPSPSRSLPSRTTQTSLSKLTSRRSAKSR